MTLSAIRILALAAAATLCGPGPVAAQAPDAGTALWQAVRQAAREVAAGPAPAAPAGAPTRPGAGTDVAAGLSFGPASPAKPPAQAPSPPSAAVQAPPPPAASATPPTAAPAAPPPPAPSAPPTISALGGDGYLAENLRIVRGARVISVPRIEIRGTRMDRAAVAGLLDPTASAGLFDRLLALSAREVVVPEISGEGDGGTLLVRDLRLANAADGRIGSLSLAGGSLALPEMDRIAFARMEADGLDLKLLLSLAEPAPAGSRPELGTALERVSLEGLSVAQPDDHSLRIARVSGRDLRVRPTAAGWSGSLDRVFAGVDGETGEKAGPEAVRQAAGAAADLFGALDLAGLEMTGLEFELRGDKPLAVRMAGASFAAGTGRGGEFRLDGLQARIPDGRASLSAFSIGGLSLAGTVDGLRTLSASTAAGTGPALARRLVPQVGTVRLGRLDVDLPDTKDGPVALTMASAEIAASDFRSGLPSALRLAVTDLVVPVKAAQGQDPTGQLGLLGLDAVGLTFRTDLGWSEATGELSLRETSLALKDLGSVTLRGVVGNVGKEVFDPDTAVATVAALGATLRTIEVEVQDRGMAERLYKATAAEAGRPVDDVRTEASAYAVVGIPPMLGNAPAGRTVGQAVGRFLAKPGRLRLRVQAKEAAGLSAAEIAGAGDPMTLLDRVEITATAE